MSSFAFGEISILKPDLIWLQGRLVHHIFDDYMSKLNTSLSNFSQYLSAGNSDATLINLIEPISSIPSFFQT